MEFKVKVLNCCPSTKGRCYISDGNYYLWNNSTVNRHTYTGKMSKGVTGYWKTEREAQEFLENWMPRKEKLTIRDVELAAQGSELKALDCSIEHWKQNVLDVENCTLGGDYCAICIRAERETPGETTRCKRCIVNDYKFWVDFNCCEEYEDFISNKTEENAIAMLNKLVKIRNEKYGNKYLEKEKMSNKIVFDDGKEVELSKETTERLRKELEPEIKWEHGDIALSHYSPHRPTKRLILIEDGWNGRGKIKIYRNDGELIYENETQEEIKTRMKLYKYKKIGNIFDDFQS